MFTRLAQSQRSILSLSVGLFYPSTLSRSKSTYLLRKPPPTAPRELATPLVFLSAEKWDPNSKKGMSSFASMFAERGYTTMEVDLTVPEARANSSTSLLSDFEAELASHIRLAGIPFPPVLFARSGGCLIAQTYISSNPASALVLISPPTSMSSPEAEALLPNAPLEFDFEPRFPLLILETPQRKTDQQTMNRLLQEEGAVDLRTVDDLEGQSALMALEQWMDEIGV